MLHYLAYGSNLHPLRLTQRVPSACLIGKVYLEGYSLQFNKRGKDSSAKCNLVKSGQQNDKVFAALYQMDSAHKEDLDGIEGRGQGYLHAKIAIEYNRQKITCFTYFAEQSHLDETLRPFHWYKELVLQGASFLEFPQHYIQGLAAVPSTPDPDVSRNAEMINLVSEVKSFSTAG